MRLAADERARVPFALVGVLVLVSSASLSASLGTVAPVRRDAAVEDAVDRAEATATPALRAAVREAARGAARNPVVAPADTPAGRVLNDSEPFRDALRIRIYLRARDRFADATYRQDGVRARASLPGIDDPADLSAAKRRVEIERLHDGTAIAVTVENVSLTARRDGRTAASESATLSVAVATPVLAVHDRTERFERRLDRGPTAGPGLGRRLTARLYPVAWARGYAQYGGAPVGDVIANRHVELAANGAALAEQRAAFGRSDPDGRRAFARAAAETGLHDLTVGTVSTVDGRSDAVLPSPVPEPPWQGTTPRYVNGESQGEGAAYDGAERGERLTVGVNRTADAALVALLDGTADRPAAAVRRDAYRAETRLATDVERVRSGSPPPARPPGENWTLVAERRSAEYEVSTPGERPNATVEAAAAPIADPSETVIEATARTVVERRTVERTWVRGNRTRTAERTWTDRYRVRIAVVGAYAPIDAAAEPDRPIEPRFERGGALGGPNLADVAAAARRDHVTDRGGPDAVAERAVEGTLETESVARYGTRPDRLEPWVYRDLAALREDVRDVTVSVPAREAATGRANPPAALATALRDRREALVDPPETYDGAADRARVAAREAYLDSVIAALAARADDTRAAESGYRDAISDAGVSMGDLRAAEEARARSSDPDRRTVGDESGLGGSVAVVPDGDPGYLTLSAVSAEHAPSLPAGERYHGLAVRNRNVFAVPYGEARDAAFEGLFGREETVALRTAGETLVAANRTLDGRTTGEPGADDEELRRQREELRREVVASLATVRRETRRILGRETDLTRGERRAAVEAALARWDGAGRRATAVDNGSYAEAVVREAASRASLAAPRDDQLATRLRVSAARTSRSTRVRVPRETTAGTASATRELTRASLRKYRDAAVDGAVDEATERAAGRRLSDLPAGLPLLPVPGSWYATVNVWTVDVRGSYPQFVVRARTGPPDGVGGALQYVRDGSAITLDVDGDGAPERLGRAERVSFETRTAVAVAVPPGGGGIGDGSAVQESPAWPRPGCASGPAADCRPDRVPAADARADAVGGPIRGRPGRRPQRLSPLADEGETCSTTQPRIRDRCRRRSCDRPTNRNSPR